VSGALDLMAPDLGVEGVAVRVTTRSGGVSEAPFNALNLGLHVGDEAQRVLENRGRLESAIGCSPIRWLTQVHGVETVEANEKDGTPTADAQWTSALRRPLAVLTADCLPVVMVSRDASCVGIAHAGWRGLAGGVLESLVTAMPVPASALVAWLGPAISAAAYEVGPEVRDAFVARLGCAAQDGFTPSSAREGHWMADLPALARVTLARAGVDRVAGGDHCTVGSAAQFYSYRRDGAATGRMATLVWRE